MKIAKWGNSLAVRIPADVAKALDLKAGDEIDIARGDGSRVEIKRRAAAVASLRRFRGRRIRIAFPHSGDPLLRWCREPYGSQ